MDKEITLITKNYYEVEPTYVKFYTRGFEFDNTKAFENNFQIDNFLFELTNIMNYENEIFLSNNIKKDLCEKLKISSAVFNSKMKKLKQQKVIIKKGYYYFKVNPFICSKGHYEEKLREEWNELNNL